MDLGTTIRYSEAFKLQVISELENGKWANYEQARRAYCINGTYTIQRWQKKYGRNDLIRRQVRVESPNEKRELEAERFIQYKERFQIPLGIAIFLLILEMIISDRKKLKIKWKGRFQ